MSNTIGAFTLTNSGGFAVKLEYQYLNVNTSTWQTMNGTDNFDAGTTKTLDLASASCPDGASVRILADIMWSQNISGDQQFTFERGSSNSAVYVVSGSAGLAHLTFNGVTVTQ